MEQAGTVVAVSISRSRGIPKIAQVAAEVGPDGLIGDVHATQTRLSHKTGQVQINDRHVTVFAQEVLDALNQELSLKLEPGDLGENITTLGLGDLSNIPNGSLLMIGGQVVLKVTAQNKPCQNLARHHPLLIKEIYGRRGLLCTVHEGVGQTICRDLMIEVL